MGTLTGQNIVDRVRRVIQDTTNGGTRWKDAELLDWVNDAQREIVLVKPNSNAVTADVTMAAGTKQSLPPTGLQLLAVIRNTGGAAIRRVERAILDAENPDWHTETPNNTAVHYIFDEDDAETFYLYPPQEGTPGSVELVYSAAPTDLGSLASTISLNDIYANVIIDYVLYRAYSKDADYAGNNQRANNHYVAYNNSLGNRVQREVEVSPNAPPSAQIQG